MRIQYSVTPTLDLQAIGAQLSEVLPRGTACLSVSVRTLTSGAAPLLLHFGRDGAGIPAAVGEEFRFASPMDRGVYVSCPGAAAGAAAVLLVVFPE